MIWYQILSTKFLKERCEDQYGEFICVRLKGIKEETRFGRREKKVNVSAAFCILVSVVCYFKFILKSKNLITDSEDRWRLKGTRQLLCNWDNFFFHPSSLASRESRRKILINLNFLLKYQMFRDWTLLWKKSENMVFHLRG